MAFLKHLILQERIGVWDRATANEMLLHLNWRYTTSLLVQDPRAVLLQAHRLRHSVAKMEG